VLDMFPQATVEVIQEQAAALRRPQLTVEDVLKALSRCGATHFAQEVQNIIAAR
jgi:hypothetical protein